jgi:3-dehydroquinate synthase
LTVALRVSDGPLVIESHAGPYTVSFNEAAAAALPTGLRPGTHVLIDARVADLHGQVLAPVLAGASILRIDATEANKSLDRIPAYIEALVGFRARRGHRLLCIGGGILQDITCFIAATLFRGIEWEMIPTTLLAQADSCIGSKSSINVGSAKNIVGTYTPPHAVYVWPGFLDTLDDREIRSGIGEMLKVHAIAGPDDFTRIADAYDDLSSNRETLLRFIRRSLETKKRLIESDEFDRGPRNVLNYGHSFGHAIEAATDFAIPHGVAITLGMDLANFVAFRVEFASRAPFDRMHPTLRKNYSAFASHPIDSAALLAALAKDKKNTDTGLRLVLPDSESTIRMTTQPASDRLRAAVGEYLHSERSI